MGQRTREYKYKVGDIVNGLEILEQGRINKDKAYRMKCTICGLGDGTPYYNMFHKCIEDGKYWNTESHLNQEIGCPCCSGHATLPNVNSVLAVRPDLIKYFLNEEEAEMYPISSTVKIELQCHSCGKKKAMKINTLARQGFGCPNCSDGVSYPERVMSNILKQLGIKYETHYRPDWSKTVEIKEDNSLNGMKEYDFTFIIDNVQYIIETHGEQHYRGGFERKNGRTLEQEQINDYYKKLIAIEKGMIKKENYIVLDCRKSNIEYIKNSIINSPLRFILEIDSINWEKIAKDSEKTLVKEVCDYWNKNYGELGTLEIGEYFNIHRATIIRYLKKGDKAGFLIVPYNAREEGSKVMTKKMSGEKNPSATSIFIYSKDMELLCQGSTQKQGVEWLFENGYINSKKMKSLLKYRDTGKAFAFKNKPNEPLYFYTKEQKRADIDVA